MSTDSVEPDTGNTRLADVPAGDVPQPDPAGGVPAITHDGTTDAAARDLLLTIGVRPDVQEMVDGLVAQVAFESVHDVQPPPRYASPAGTFMAVNQWHPGDRVALPNVPDPLTVVAVSWPEALARVRHAAVGFQGVDALITLPSHVKWFMVSARRAVLVLCAVCDHETEHTIDVVTERTAPVLCEDCTYGLGDDTPVRDPLR